MRKILFRGKINNMSKGNAWYEGYIAFPSDNEAIIIYDATDEDGWEYVFPETIGQHIGYTDFHNQKIFDGDIIEFTLGNERKERYLIWYNKEICSIVDVQVDGIRFNGNDYWNPKFANNNWSEFCLMLQNIYGYFSDIKVIGNIYDNPELISG